MAADPRALSAREAAELLGVSLATLYAYVSRGLIRSQAHGAGRDKRYDAADVTALLERKAQRKEPGKAARAALDWGPPVLESAITAIEGNHLFYRGRSVAELARTSTFEGVAALLWGLPFASSTPPPHSPRLARALESLLDVPAIDRVAALLPLARLEDLAALDPRPEAQAQAGTRIVHLLAGWIAPGGPPGAGIAATLAGGWGLSARPDTGRGSSAATDTGRGLPAARAARDAGRVLPAARAALDAALILAADHEFNVGTFTARCVASTGGTLYDAVTAGLAALRGPRHGGMTERVEALFNEAGEPGRARAAIAARLRRGEGSAGFGHPLYPGGDPRGQPLIDLARGLAPESPAVQLADALQQAGLEVLDEHPTIDFGLVTLTRVLELPAGSALSLFALGRTAGWIAHALEQAASPHLIRPRAHYVGLAPSV